MKPHSRNRKEHIIREAGVEHAIKAAGGTIVALARLLGLNAKSVAGWAEVPPKRVLQIERLVPGTSPHVMRPDLHPIEERSPHD